MRLGSISFLLLAACPGDDASGTGTETEGTGTSTSTSSSTGPTSLSTSSSSSTSTSTTDGTTTDETTGTGEDSTTGPALPGLCVGLDQVGTLGEVAALDEATVDPTCTTTPAGCGGDIVGVWTVASTCGWEDTPNFFADCPGSTMTVTDGSLTGTRTFNADMTFAFDLETTLAFDLSLDAMSCFGGDCPMFEDLLIAQGFTGTCSDAGGGMCDCTLGIVAPNTTTGTWATADTVLVLTTPDGEAGLEYCVMTDRLETWTPILQSTLYEEPCAEDVDCTDALGNLSEFYICVIP